MKKYYMNELISVIVPIYNVEPYLKMCVDSIINQTYRNLEIILVDDGSSDNCGTICDEYAKQDHRVVVLHKENAGLSEARNAGMQLMHGDYILFVDSDDWIGQSYIQTIMENAPFDIAMTGYSTVDECGNNSEAHLIRVCNDVKHNSNILSELIKRSFFGYAWCKMYRTAAISGIRFSNIPLREDFAYNILAFSASTQIISLAEVAYYYRQRETSILHQRYKGSVPDLLIFPRRIILDFESPGSVMNRELGNSVIKTYLMDGMKKYIFQNDALSRKEKKKYFYSVLNCSELRRFFKIFGSETSFFCFLTICVKYRLCFVLFSIMEVIFRE